MFPRGPIVRSAPVFLVGTDPVEPTPAGVKYSDSDPVRSFSDMSVGLPDLLTVFLIAKLC